MDLDLKYIHIGYLIYQCVVENNIQTSRICNFLKCSEEDIATMYKSKSLDTELLLNWSKLLKYDFFRIYSQHFILYVSPSVEKEVKEVGSSFLPQFRKSIYSQEIIDFILQKIKTGEKTKLQVIKEYNIPKTTLHEWIKKHKI